MIGSFILSFTFILLILKEIYGQNETRIVGGDLAEEHEFPYIVSLQTSLNVPILNPRLGFCAAAIIAPNFLLGVAHCFQQQTSRTSFIAVAGVNNLRDGAPKIRQERTILYSDVIRHPGFRVGRYSVQNDIALIRVKEPFVFNEFVQPIKLPLKDLEPADEYVAAGWGYTYAFGQPTNLLRKVTLPLFSKDDCRRRYPLYTVSDNVFCAGGVRGRASCSGDSGGPIIKMSPNVTLEGLNSWIGPPPPCGSTGAPVVCTQISKYTDWIEQEMGKQ